MVSADAGALWLNLELIISYRPESDEFAYELVRSVGRRDWDKGPAWRCVCSVEFIVFRSIAFSLGAFTLLRFVVLTGDSMRPRCQPSCRVCFCR